MKSSILVPVKILAMLTLLTGFIYPMIITGIGQVLFPGQANGSLIYIDKTIVGSKLIGQRFDSAIYFWPRPSVIDYNPLPSGGSNLGPTSIRLKAQKDERSEKIIKDNGLDENAIIPGDLIFASASGLDPHISRESAMLQVNRVTKARRFTENRKKEVLELINHLTEKPQLGIFGNERIDVLSLNIELDKIK